MGKGRGGRRRTKAMARMARPRRGWGSDQVPNWAVCWASQIPGIVLEGFLEVWCAAARYDRRVIYMIESCDLEPGEVEREDSGLPSPAATM